MPCESHFCPQCGSPADRWILAAEYKALTGETNDSIRNLRRQGEWIEQVHYRYDPRGRLWINYSEVMKWLEGEKSPKASSSERTHQVA